MTQKIAQQRQLEFNKILQQIKSILQHENLYEREEATKQMLLQSINQVKNDTKLEIEQRKSADDEILASLNQYQAIIEKEVTRQRAEVVKSREKT